MSMLEGWNPYTKKTIVQTPGPDKTLVTLTDLPMIVLTPCDGTKIVLNGVRYTVVGQPFLVFETRGPLGIALTSTIVVEPA